MSTPAPQEPQGWGDEKQVVRQQPRLFVCGVVKGIGEVKVTGNGEGDYSICDILVDSSNGSNRKIKPRFMFRPEMFATGFSGSVYGSMKAKSDIKPGEIPSGVVQMPGEDTFVANSVLNFVPEGKNKTLGQSFWHVYHMNVLPEIGYSKKTDAYYFKKLTPLAALAGGSIDGWNALKRTIGELGRAASGEPNELGLVEPTNEQVAETLKGFIASVPQYPQVFELKQSRDKDGDLTDFYEVSSYRGVLEHDMVQRLQKEISRSTIKKAIAFTV